MVPGFSKEQFSYSGVTHDVYKAGRGPAVIVIHEIPGITPQVHRFAQWVVDAGFTVYLPHLFGQPMKPPSIPYALSEMARACISREFSVWAANKSSPITDWLRALARKAYSSQGGRGVGAIGMCLTGNFAIAMMVDEFLMAPVLCQPSLPFALGAGRQAALHASKEELTAAQQRINEGAKILGLRFKDDPTCPALRFQRLREEFGSGFEAIEIEDRFANPQGNPFPHSVLTSDLIDEAGQPTKQAAERVIQFFKDQLQ